MKILSFFIALEIDKKKQTKKKLISGLDCGDGNDERKITKKGIVDCLFLYIVPRKQ